MFIYIYLLSCVIVNMSHVTSNQRVAVNIITIDETKLYH